MIYKVKKKKIKKSSKCLFSSFKGYPLASKNHKFVIAEMEVKNIIALDQEFVEVLVFKRVYSKYEKLLKTLTELLVSDDDGTCCREALNLIEKFRLEIKNKYRFYLKEKELKMMAAKLRMMQQIAIQKEIEVRSFVTEETIGKAR